MLDKSAKGLTSTNTSLFSAVSLALLQKSVGVCFNQFFQASLIFVDKSGALEDT
jgi:hypothetical protein